MKVLFGMDALEAAKNHGITLRHGPNIIIDRRKAERLALEKPNELYALADTNIDRRNNDYEEILTNADVDDSVLCYYKQDPDDPRDVRVLSPAECLRDMGLYPETWESVHECRACITDDDMLRHIAEAVRLDGTSDNPYELEAALYAYVAIARHFGIEPTGDEFIWWHWWNLDEAGYEALARYFRAIGILFGDDALLKAAKEYAGLETEDVEAKD